MNIKIKDESYEIISYEKKKVLTNKVTINFTNCDFQKVIELCQDESNIDTFSIYDGENVIEVFSGYSIFRNANICTIDGKIALKIILEETTIADIKKTLGELKNDVLGLEQQVSGDIEIATIELEEYKTIRQNENKLALAAFLRDNPIEFLGNTYPVDLESQQEMANDLAAYQLKQQFGDTSFKLMWHTSKGACTEMEEVVFMNLLSNIISYVFDYRRLQELYKVRIYSCGTKEDLSKIEFTYSRQALIDNGIVTE